LCDRFTQKFYNFTLLSGENPLWAVQLNTKAALSKIPITLSPKKTTQGTALTSHNLLQLYTLHIHSPQSHI
jgi:hypothetical protein